MLRKELFFRIVSLLLVIGFLCGPQLAHANNSGGYYGNVKQRCEQIRADIISADNDGVWLVESIVSCVKLTVQEAFLEFATQFYPVVSTAISAAVTLAVILFGVLLVSGMVEKSSRDTFVFLFKLGCVAYFVQTPTVEWIYESGIGAMDKMTDTMFTYGKGSESEGRCRIQSNDTMWDRVDCMLDVLIGIHKEPTGQAASGKPPQVSPEIKGISRGMMHFFSSMMGSSPVGTVIAFLGFYAVFTLMFAVIKAVHTYLAAVLGLAFILVLTPMFVPLILFKETRNYFDKWYRIAVAFVIQPMILFGFLSLMMIALDTVLVSGDNSVLGMITGGEQAQKVPSQSLEDKQVFASHEFAVQYRQLSADAGAAAKMSEKLTGVMEGAPATPQGTSIRDEQLRGVVQASRPFEGVNYERLAQAMQVGDETEAKQQLTYAAILMALTMFVFLSMMNYIPTLATDLAGGVYEVPNLYDTVGKHFLGQEQAELAAKNLSQRVRSSSFMQGAAQMIGTRR